MGYGVAALEVIVWLSICLSVRKRLCYSNHIIYGSNKHNSFSTRRAYVCRFQVVIFQAIQKSVLILHGIS